MVVMFKTVSCLLLLLSHLFYASEVVALDIMLPQVYEENIDISGWLVSEKLDGVRGYWDGKALLSKNGIAFQPPAAFLVNFPDFAIEGEIWGGRGTFEQTCGAIKKQKAHNGWLNLKFAVFDVPGADGGFVKRLEKAKEWFVKNPSDYAFVVPQKLIKNQDELQEELQKVESLGGEGLMVRRPDSPYAPGRNSEILKVKSYQDSEAVIIAHIAGKGKNKGKLGSLLVELPSGLRFKIGTGFSDAERENPPALGATITFKYYGTYQSGLPKFSSFLRVRLDREL